MSKKLFALEELEEVCPSAIREEIEAIQTENTESMERDTNTLEAIHDAENVEEGLSDLEEVAEASIIDDGEGLDSSTVRTIEVAVEHFGKVLQYKKKPLPALEGYRNSGNKKEITTSLLSELRSFRSGVHDAIAVAFESMGGITVLINSQLTIAESGINDATILLKRNPKFVTTDISGGRWSRGFGGFHEETISAASVISRAEKALQLLNSSGIVSLCEEVSVVCAEIIKNNNPDNVISHISSFEAKANKIADVASIYHKELLLGEDSRCEFTPLTNDEAKDILGIATKLISELDKMHKYLGDIDELTLKTKFRTLLDKMENPGKMGIAGAVIGFVVGGGIFSLFTTYIGWKVGKSFDKKGSAQAKTVQNDKISNSKYSALTAISRDILEMIISIGLYVDKSIVGGVYKDKK